jgi:excisionase family DNA binding protein
MAKVLSIKEAAAALGCHPMYMRKLVREGKIEAAKGEGARWEIDAASVNAYAKAKATKSAAAAKNKAAKGKGKGKGKSRAKKQQPVELEDEGEDPTT